MAGLSSQIELALDSGRNPAEFEAQHAGTVCQADVLQSRREALKGLEAKAAKEANEQLLGLLTAEAEQVKLGAVRTRKAAAAELASAVSHWYAVIFKANVAIDEIDDGRAVAGVAAEFAISAL